MFWKVGVEHCEISKPTARMLLIPMLCTEQHITLQTHTRKVKWRFKLQSLSSSPQGAGTCSVKPLSLCSPANSSTPHGISQLILQADSVLAAYGPRGTLRASPLGPCSRNFREPGAVCCLSHHTTFLLVIIFNFYSLLSFPTVVLTSTLYVPVLFPSQPTSHLPLPSCLT